MRTIPDTIARVRAFNPGPTARGFLWLALSFYCGTFFFISTKYILNHLDKVSFFTWWYGIALVFHTVYGLSSEGVVIEKIHRQCWKFLALYVAFDLLGTYTFFYAIKLMDPSISSFLNQSQIIFTLFLGHIFLKEVLIREEVAASLVIIAGVVTMTFKSVYVPPLGAALITLSNLTSASNFIIVRKIGKHLGTLTFARVRTTVLFTVFFTHNMIARGGITVPSPDVLAVLFFGSLFGPFLNVISIYKCLEYIPAGKLALFRSLQPIFVMAAAGAVLKTFPGPRETAGGVIIIAGCVILAYYHAQHVIGLKRPLRPPRQ